MPTAEDIPFRSIPHQSALFLSYLDLSSNALRFFQNPPTMESIERLSREGLARIQFRRREIASILRRQNESYGGDPETLRHIGYLEEPDCVAILTGQQVGLFTGPLYTIYKALTAVQIAADLKNHGIKAVPIFWMDSEDHDLAEVTRRTAPGSNSSVQVVDCRKALFGEKDLPLRSVGSIQFPESIRQVVKDYVSRFPDSVWKPEIQSLLESTYKPGASLAQSFARLLSQILRGRGLVIFDPHDTEVKRLAAAVFQRALRDADAIHLALVKRNQELEAVGFHAQVSIQENSTVLFIFADGERRALERRNSGFGMRNSDRIFSREELLENAEKAPEIFSPNVLLRPLVQDHLFPTAAYVGGSSEIAYFAQIEALYPLFGRPLPVIWPRNSFTLIEPGIGAEMDRFGIEIQDCFPGKQHLMEKALRNSGFSKAAASLQELREHLDQVFTEVRPGVQAVAPPLTNALDIARSKILHNIQRLKSLIVRLEAKQNTSVLAAADLLLNYCYPNKNLQERELNVLAFLARHGPALLNMVCSALEIGNFAHRSLRLDEATARE